MANAVTVRGGTPNVRDAVLADLRAHGPSTYRAVAERLCIKPSSASSALSVLVKHGAALHERRVYSASPGDVLLPAWHSNSRQSTSVLSEVLRFDEDPQARFAFSYFMSGQPITTADEIARDFGCSMSEARGLRRFLAFRMDVDRGEMFATMRELAGLFGLKHQRIDRCEKEALASALKNARRLGLEDDFREYLRTCRRATFAEEAERMAFAYGDLDSEGFSKVSPAKLAERSGQALDRERALMLSHRGHSRPRAA